MMTEIFPENALCIDCNYPLRDLPAARCPECGRPFDPLNRSSFNTGQPLGWIHHAIRGPIGWPTFSYVVAKIE